MPELGYKRRGDTVTLTMTVNDFHLVLIALGISASSEAGADLKILDLANRLNLGNPNYDQYEIPDTQGGRTADAGGKF